MLQMYIHDNLIKKKHKTRHLFAIFLHCDLPEQSVQLLQFDGR